ncbi:MAG: pyridoxamine 5'-phosphate oxidase family protein [Acidimicrobiales bacterium]
MEENVPTQSSLSSPPPSPDVEVHRVSERASYETAVINAIVDNAIVAHVGTVRDGLPVVIPMFCVRDGDSLLLHGAPAAGTVRRGQTGIDVCVEMTIVDGLVLARSAFHHSINYRSVVVLGQAEAVSDPAEKEAALELFVERLMAGRQAELRPTTAKEIQGTSVLRVSLAKASAKVRAGGPVDDDEDYATNVWAGVVPVATVFGSPINDSLLADGIEVPAKVQALVGRQL